MAFVARRFLSSTTRLYTAVSTPAPVDRVAVLGTPELQALSKKSQGSWKELTNEEQITLYRATFPQTFREANTPPGGSMKVFIGVSVGIIIGYFLAAFLRDTVGPTLPHTFNNKQWEEDTKAKLIRQKANPIEGICSTS